MARDREWHKATWPRVHQALITSHFTRDPGSDSREALRKMLLVYTKGSTPGNCYLWQVSFSSPS